MILVFASVLVPPAIVGGRLHSALTCVVQARDFQDVPWPPGIRWVRAAPERRGLLPP